MNPEQLQQLLTRLAYLETRVAAFDRGSEYRFERTIHGGTSGLNIDASTKLKLGLAGTDKIGFYGTTPVIQQLGASGTAGGVYGGTEAAMLNNTYLALRAYGLLV